VSVKIIYTTTFFFLDKGCKPPLSSLKQGPGGVFGVVISAEDTYEDVLPKDLDEYTLPCVFLEIDLRTGVVSERSTAFLYTRVWDVQNEYDAVNEVWIASFRATVRETDSVAPPRISLDFYEIASKAHSLWKNLLSLEEAKNESYYQVIFWQQQASFPLVCAKMIEDGDLTNRHLFWRQWRTENSATPDTVRLLRKCFLEAPYRFEKTFLLFTGEYQQRSGRWCLRINVYDSDGIHLSSRLIPKISFPNRHTGYSIADDVWDWFCPTIRLAHGPSIGDEERPTCVAVLLFKERSERTYAWNKGHLPEIHHDLPLIQGGLYWIDNHGHILCSTSSLLGEQVSLCLCGTMIIGTDCLDGQRRLWSWSPIDKTELAVRVVLPPEGTRVTLVATENACQEAVSLFWCIEEYPQGIRVSLWKTETFQEVQFNWVTEVQLADHQSELTDYRDTCATAYQDTLLIIGITQEGQFQVIQFSVDESSLSCD
jgi:hypothetical protein